MAFGGKSWAISPADMNLGTISQDGVMCAGGIFDLAAGTNVPTGTGAPTWIIGDTFLVRHKICPFEMIADTEAPEKCIHGV